jgi:hypothetical protein
MSRGLQALARKRKFYHIAFIPTRVARVATNKSVYVNAMSVGLHANHVVTSALRIESLLAEQVKNHLVIYLKPLSSLQCS